MNKERIRNISKLCSYLLRHKPEAAHLTIDENGWIKVDELLENCAKHHFEFSFEELHEVVISNDKKRFSFNEDQTEIRANQGHSVAVNVKLKAEKPPKTLYHGTAQKNLESILQKGIQKQNRLHVHLSSDLETAKAVGSRHGKPIILEIDAAIMYEDGIKFYLSENGVWLVDSILPNFIKLVP